MRELQIGPVEICALPVKNFSGLGGTALKLLVLKSIYGVFSVQKIFPAQKDNVVLPLTDPGIDSTRTAEAWIA